MTSVTRYIGTGAATTISLLASFDEAQKTTFVRFVNPIWPVTERIPRLMTPWTLNMNNHLDIVNGFARDVIKKLRAQLEAGEVHKDLFSRFMDASNNNGNILNNDEFLNIVLNSVNAVRDTTTQALFWIFYMLMCHLWMETKLLEEIEKFISHDDLTNSSSLYKKIKCMPYAHAIFYEVLRLYPSVPLNQKFTLNDDIWPVKIRIKK